MGNATVDGETNLTTYLTSRICGSSPPQMRDDCEAVCFSRWVPPAGCIRSVPTKEEVISTLL